MVDPLMRRTPAPDPATQGKIPPRPPSGHATTHTSRKNSPTGLYFYMKPRAYFVLAGFLAADPNRFSQFPPAR